MSPEAITVSPKINRSCLICSKRVHKSYLGVDACRVCGEFFRRTTPRGIHFVCRQGTSNCDVTKYAEYPCKSCRYAKCVRAGLSLRAKEGEQDYTEDELRRLTEGRTELQDVCQQESISGSSACRSAEQSSSGMDSPALPELSLLKRIEQSYRVMCSVRRASELAQSALTSFKPIFGSQTSFPPFTPATFLQLNACHRIATIALYEFADSVIDGFRDLPSEDKLIIMRGCYFPFVVVEDYIRTLKEFPEDDKILLVSWTHYMRMDDLDIFYSDAPMQTQRPEADRVMKTMMDDMQRVIRPLVIDADIDEIEFFGFVGLTFACISNVTRGLSERARTIAEDFHTRLLREFHLYYRHHRRLHDYSVRLCKIMFLLSTSQWRWLQELSATALADLELYRLLDMVTVDNFIYQFHNGV